MAMPPICPAMAGMVQHIMSGLGKRKSGTGTKPPDGIDDYVDVGDFELGGAVSFSAWVKYEAFNNNSSIFHFTNGGGKQQHSDFKCLASSASRFYHNSPSGIELLGGDFILNEWMHLAGVIQANGNMQLYLNASLSAQRK